MARLLIVLALIGGVAWLLWRWLAQRDGQDSGADSFSGLPDRDSGDRVDDDPD